jgi:NhaC family Na+:H+ antiporter
VFSIIGLITNVTDAAETSQTITLLEKTFHISPWLLLAPVVTCTLIVLRVKVLLTLFISTLMGVCCLVFMQPSIFGLLTAENGAFWAIVNVLCTETSINTGSDMLNNLVSTSGISGMLETIKLVLCAMLFGGALIGTGMLSSITRKLSQKLNGLRKIVSTTVGTGLLVNACTGDQYLSLIITGNIYKNLYSRNGLEPRLLSRSLEDSISVTSVLIPWNSCGMTQSTVLGVNTFYYLPYCVFNYMCPIISIIVASIGYKIYRRNNKAE